MADKADKAELKGIITIYLNNGKRGQMIFADLHRADLKELAKQIKECLLVCDTRVS